MTYPSAPETAVPAPPASPALPKAGPVGIGGWLILPIIGFVGTIALTAWSVVSALRSWDGLVAIFTASEGPLAQIRVPVAASLVAGLLVIASAAWCLYLM